jgi:hypothetical protein
MSTGRPEIVKSVDTSPRSAELGALLPGQENRNLSFSQMSHIDYDIHGLAGVRLVGAGPADAAAVARQLGPLSKPLAGTPDLVLRFVDRLELRSPLRYVGLHEAGFTDDAFLVLRSKYKANARVQIPFERVGEPLEILCERGLPAVPLLIPILNLRILNKGHLPLHAAAFEHRGTGVLCTGWSKGGKTEALLAFMGQGASYVGDEWVYISRDGEQMHGIPEPIRVWNWHLESLPQLRSALPGRTRARLRGVGAAVQAARAAAALGVGGARRMAGFAERQHFADLAPHALFGAARCALSARLDRIVFIGSHERPELCLEAIAPSEVASRMLASLQEELAPFRSYYLKFRFAFPRRRNAWFEGVEEVQRKALLRSFEGRPCFSLQHPYPVELPKLYEALEPLCDRPESEPARVAGAA